MMDKHVKVSIVAGFCLAILDAAGFTLLYEAQFYKSLKPIHDISRTIFAEPTLTALFFTGLSVVALVSIALITYGFFNLYKRIKYTKIWTEPILTGTPIKSGTSSPVTEGYSNDFTESSKESSESEEKIKTKKKLNFDTDTVSMK